MSVFSQFLTENEIEIILVFFDKRSFQLSVQIVGDIDSYIDVNYVRESHRKEYPVRSRSGARRRELSAAGWLYDSIERTREVARATANVTHNHPEGIKGAEAFYGILAVLIAECKSRIDKGMMTDVLDEFDHVLGSKSVDTYPSNVSGDAKIYLNVGIVIFCLLWYILSIMFDVWYIHLEPTQIIYRNYLGEKKVIKASDIYYFERNSNGSLIIVCSDETKVSFEPEYADSNMLWMSEQSIKTKNARKKDRFIIRPAKYQRVLSVLCLVVFLAFLLLGIFTYNVVVSLIFGLLLIFGIWNCGYHYSKKYTIGNGYIEESSILKRKKLIAYVDISEAEIKQGDNVTYILLFDKRSKRPIIKINMYYENAFLIKELAYKMNWLK